MIDQELEVDVDTVSRDLLVALVVLISRLLIAAAPMSRLVIAACSMAVSGMPTNASPDMHRGAGRE